MNTLFMNSKKSKTFDLLRILLNLTNKIDLKQDITLTLKY